MADSLLTNGPLNAADQSVELSCRGLGGVAIQIQGTFTGTITFEASVQGKDFAAFRVVPSNSSTAVTTATAAGLWAGSTVGYAVVRARMSAYTSGTAYVFLCADTASPGGSSSGGGAGSDVNLIEVGGSAIALGQAAMAASLPVVLASDQSAIDVTIVGGGGGGTSSAFGAAFPADGTAIGIADPDGTMAALSAETLDYDTDAGTVAQTIIGLALPGAGGPVAGGTSANPVRVDPTGTTTQPVSAASLPLPTGAATLAEQQAETALLTTIDGDTGTLAGIVTSSRAAVNPIVGQAGITGGAGVVDATTTRVAIATDANAVSVSSLPLPTGAATLAEQQTQTTALGTLLTSANFAAAFGTAGTADTQVMSVQGIASMTPVQVSQATASNLNAQVVGDVAADSADAGNPVKMGMIAYSPDGTTPGTAVAELDRSNAKSDLDGRLYVNAAAPRWWTFHSDGSSALTDTSVQADPGDGFQIVITNIVFSTGAATACNIFFEEGASKILGPWYLEAVAGRGLIWVGEKKVTASTALTVTTSAAIAQCLDVQGYIQAV